MACEEREGTTITSHMFTEQYNMSRLLLLQDSAVDEVTATEWAKKNTRIELPRDTARPEQQEEKPLGRSTPRTVHAAGP